MKYRKKPVEIEAVQFRQTSDSIRECLILTGNKATLFAEGDSVYMLIHTLEGDMKAPVDDYIIKGVKGEFYPCKPDIFELTYEKAE